MSNEDELLGRVETFDDSSSVPFSHAIIHHLSFHFRTWSQGLQVISAAGSVRCLISLCSLAFPIFFAISMRAV